MTLSTTKQYKLDKSQAFGYLTGGLNLAPANSAANAGHDIPTTCAMAGACAAACLQFAGRTEPLVPDPRPRFDAQLLIIAQPPLHRRAGVHVHRPPGETIIPEGGAALSVGGGARLAPPVAVEEEQEAERDEHRAISSLTLSAAPKDHSASTIPGTCPPS